MDAELKRKWLHALRSGQYQQDKGKLRTPNGYCCLGVLCDLIDPSGWNETVVDQFDDDLTATSFDWYWNEGLVETNPSMIGMDYEDQNFFAGLNDGGKSFQEIADRIETHDFATI